MRNCENRQVICGTYLEIAVLSTSYKRKMLESMFRKNFTWFWNSFLETKEQICVTDQKINRKSEENDDGKKNYSYRRRKV